MAPTVSDLERIRSASNGANGGQSSGGPAPPGAPRPSWRLLAGVAIAALAIGGGVAVLLVGSGDKARTPSPVSSTTHARTAPSTPIAKAEALAVLDEYAKAYSAESVTRLDALFAPGFERRNGDDPVESRSQALVAYARQFASLTDPVYRLTLVAHGSGGDIAGDVARYSISSASGTSTGTIRFELERTGGNLLITSITTYPSSAGAPTTGPGTPQPATPAAPKQYAQTCRVAAWYTGTGFSANYGYIHFKCVDESSGTTVAEALGSDNFSFRDEAQGAKQTAKRVELVDQLRTKLESAGWTALGTVSGGDWYELRFGR